MKNKIKYILLKNSILSKINDENRTSLDMLPICLDVEPIQMDVIKQVHATRIKKPTSLDIQPSHLNMEQILNGEEQVTRIKKPTSLDIQPSHLNMEPDRIQKENVLESGKINQSCEIQETVNDEVKILNMLIARRKKHEQEVKDKENVNLEEYMNLLVNIPPNKQFKMNEIVELVDGRQGKILRIEKDKETNNYGFKIDIIPRERIYMPDEIKTNKKYLSHNFTP